MKQSGKAQKKLLLLIFQILIMDGLLQEGSDQNYWIVKSELCTVKTIWASRDLLVPQKNSDEN